MNYVLIIMTTLSVIGIIPFMFGMFDSGGIFWDNYFLVFVCIWAWPLAFITMGMWIATAFMQ